MNIKTFLNRPILACVISVMIVLVGVIGLVNLPMEQYPDIAPPTISVSATYSGANAETVLKSVVVPLEESINGVENMAYMTSTATNQGSATITVNFEQGTDPDMATVNVKNRVSQAEGKLPAEVTKIGVTVEKRQNSMLKIISLFSPDDSFDNDFITNYFKINVEPKILRIKGVGSVNTMGSEYAMRIWLNPQKMAQYKLEPADVIGQLDTQNVEAATGTLGDNSANTFQYTLKYRGRYEKAPEFGNIVIKALNGGEVLRLKDVARVELGVQSYAYSNQVNSHPGTTAMVSQTAGSNAHDINTQIDRLLDEIQEELPEGLEIKSLMDTNDFLNAATSEVVQTLLETIVLVVLVVFVFLQSLRSTIIPTISIIVSLIGTFAFMYAYGFSLNLLTLFALVLVIGTVVDDAIVVVEAVQARFDEGERSPREATARAMDGIATAIFTTSLVFMAVFIPTSFMGGTSGTYYEDFGLTMAVAVGISAVNALTLCPALCSLIMRPWGADGTEKPRGFSEKFHLAFDAAFRSLVLRYKNGLRLLFRHKWLSWSMLAVCILLLGALMTSTKTGLIPDEDMGTLFVNVTTPPGSTLSQTRKAMKEVEDSLKTIPEVEAYSNVAGYSSLSGQTAAGGMIITKLRNWDDRTQKGQDINSVIGRILMKTTDIKSASIFAFAQPTIMGYGMSNGFELYIQDRKGGTVSDLMSVTNNFIAGLNKREEISQAYTAFSAKYPQYLVEVDAAKCERAGITPTTVLNVLNGYIGGNYASNFNAFSKLYRVMVQAPADYRLDRQALDNMFVRTAQGEMAPVGHFLTLRKIYSSESLTRFNLYTSIAVNGQPADGYSSGDAIRAIKEVAKETLPRGYGYEFSGMTREESRSTSNTYIIFVLCIVFVYLILCALYESLFIPLAVMLSVPFGLLGSFLFAWAFGLENNVYMQVGLIMLIGLLAKTAILLTEYASARRREGMTIAQAAMGAAGARLRPILMTALTMVVGMLPLAFSSGAGANGNISLSLGVIGGMAVGTVALLFVVPVFFIAFQAIQERVMPRHIVMFISVAAASVLLDGCGLYTGYSRERATDEADLLVTSADTVDDADEAARMAALSWREMFTDPHLQQLIGEALENNADLRTARLKTIEAKASLSAARKALLPSIDLAANAAASSFDGAKAVQTWSAGAEVSWEADIFGRLTNEKRMAQATVEEREAFIQAVQSQLISTVASQYFTLLALDRKTELTGETIVSWREYVSTLEALVEAGQGTRADVAQAEASLLATEALLEQLRQQTINTENSLCALVGRMPGQIARNTICTQHMSSAALSGISVAQLAMRPDVRGSEARLKQAFYGTAKAKSNLYPNLTLSGSAGWTNNGGAGVSNPGAALLSAAASLVQPIFNRGRLTANLKIAQAQQQEAAIEWKQSVLDAAKEVNDALAACQTSKQRCLLISGQVEMLRKTVGYTEEQMRYGEANLLQVLIARQQLLSAQLDLTAEHYTQLQSLTTLYQTLGGGCAGNN